MLNYLFFYLKMFYFAFFVINLINQNKRKKPQSIYVQVCPSDCSAV